MGRWINADAFASTGQGLTGNNMFAYCGNNPIVRKDSSGHFWDTIDKINEKLKKAEDAVNKWINNNFGAGATIEHEVSREKELIPSPLNLLISIKQGTKTTNTIREYGDTSKLFSLYAVGRSDNYLLSSVGIQANIYRYNLDLSLGLDDTGISGSYTIGNRTRTLGIVLNPSQFKVGFDFSNTVTSGNKFGGNITHYTNVSISALGIVAVYKILASGQWDIPLASQGAV